MRRIRIKTTTKGDFLKSVFALSGKQFQLLHQKCGYNIVKTCDFLQIQDSESHCQ